jgi:hypothetical protein
MKRWQSMRETILYIGRTQKDVTSFLEYIQKKLKENQITNALEKGNTLLTTKVDIVGKSINGINLGCGYGWCLNYCLSSDFEKNKCTDLENEKLKQILMHTAIGAKEVSELELMYMLGLF